MKHLKLFKIIVLPLLIVISTSISAQFIEGIDLGNKAPELEGQSFTGETYKLSSLQGKLVLIDFWASWCAPCRHENPNVVAAYNRFKDKEFKKGSGFTIFGVSLDKSENNWKKAVSYDELIWEYHISDLKFWYSDHAKAYRVNQIPTNFLIDENGIIIAKNLRGQNLPYILNQLLE